MKKTIHIATYQEAATKLADVLPPFKAPVVVRLGGSMNYSSYPIQVNSAQSILNSINKLKQKQLLLDAKIPTLPLLDKPEYPCVIKGVVRSMGTKVFVIRNAKEFVEAKNKIGGAYMLEPLFETTSEYRLHCDRNEVFFSVKKIKDDGHKDDIVINAENHHNIKEFVKPRLWKEIQAECVKAMTALDLDIACFDVIYCSKNDLQHSFAIVEANTNPELLANTFNAYKDQLVKIINYKFLELEIAEKKKAEPIVVKEKLVYVELPKKQLPLQKELKKEFLTDEQKCRVIDGILKDDYWISGDGELLNIKL